MFQSPTIATPVETVNKWARCTGPSKHWMCRGMFVVACLICSECRSLPAALQREEQLQPNGFLEHQQNSCHRLVHAGQHRRTVHSSVRVRALYVHIMKGIPPRQQQSRKNVRIAYMWVFVILWIIAQARTHTYVFSLLKVGQIHLYMHLCNTQLWLLSLLIPTEM